MKIVPASQVSKLELEAIYQEAVPYFDEIEGRLPLHPLQTLSEIIPGIPDSKTLCLAVLKNEQTAGYLWLLEEEQENLYLLFFYVAESFRHQGLAREVLADLWNEYRAKGCRSVRLMVSALNQLGLSFWFKQGFDRITLVESPEAGMPTKGIELELKKEL